MGRQGMELWRPDWPTIYKGSYKLSLPDKDNELLTVTRETLRVSLTCIEAQIGADAYHHHMAAAAELRKVLEEKK